MFNASSLFASSWSKRSSWIAIFTAETRWWCCSIITQLFSDFIQGIHLIQLGSIFCISRLVFHSSLFYQISHSSWLSYPFLYMLTSSGPLSSQIVHIMISVTFSFYLSLLTYPFFKFSLLKPSLVAVLLYATLIVFHTFSARSSLSVSASWFTSPASPSSSACRQC